MPLSIPAVIPLTWVRRSGSRIKMVNTATAGRAIARRPGRSGRARQMRGQAREVVRLRGAKGRHDRLGVGGAHMPDQAAGQIGPQGAFVEVGIDHPTDAELGFMAFAVELVFAREHPAVDHAGADLLLGQGADNLEGLIAAVAAPRRRPAAQGAGARGLEARRRTSRGASNRRRGSPRRRRIRPARGRPALCRSREILAS